MLGEMAAQIPVVDFEKIEGNSEMLREIGRTWGCFRLINHGVSTKLMANMKSMANELFNRPVDIKERIKEVIPLSGYRPPTAMNSSYEGFAFHDLNPQTLSSFCSDLQLSDPQREVLEMYTEATFKLAVDVANKLATSMGLEDYSFENWHLEVRVNKYTTTQETLGSTGALLHTDDTFVTVLQDDENLGGLQAMDPCHTFVDVNPLPNSFVVNLGDTALAWSNGELRNVQHRVECKDAGIRFSIATLLIPDPDGIVEPHPFFVKDGEPPRYAPFNYKNLRKVRAQGKFAVGEALINLVE